MLGSRLKRTLCGWMGVALISLCWSVSAEESSSPLVLNYRLEDDTYNPFVEAMNQLSQHISDATNGRITLKRRIGGLLTSTSDIVLDCILGTLDMVLVPVNRLSNITPGPQLLSVPYLFSRDDFDIIMHPENATIRKLLDEINSQEPRLMGLDVWYGGYLQLLMRDHPALSPDDLKDQNMWVRGEGPDRDYLISMGAIPAEMSVAMARVAARHGYVDGIMMPVPMIVSSQLHRNMHFLSLTSHARLNYVLLMSGSTWEKLSQEDRDLIRHQAQVTGVFVRYLTTELEEIDTNRLRHLESVKVYDPDPELFRKHSEYVRELYIKSYPVEADMLRSELKAAQQHQDLPAFQD